MVPKIDNCRRMSSGCMSSFPENLVVVIAGSTGVGKSDVAAQICAKHQGMVVSADSVQVYRGVQIGANKPTLQERDETPHLLIDVADASQLYNAADWRKDTLACIRTFLNKQNAGDVHEESPREKMLQTQIQELRSKHGYQPNAPILPVVVGGTMMYLQWLVHGRPDAARPTEDALRKARKTVAQFQAKGPTGWEDAVSFVSSSLDPVFGERASKLSTNDWYRLRRTLEVAYTAMDKKDLVEALYNGQREGGLESFGYDVRCFFLCPDDRMSHTAVVDRRCEDMLLRGLLEETTELAASSTLPDMASKAIGYRQVLDYLQRPNPQDNDSEAFEGFLNDFSTATRRYAKRQMQWFRKDNQFAFVPVDVQKDKSERVQEAATIIQEMCSLPRAEFEEELLDKTSGDKVPRSAKAKQRNAEQGKGMKFYQFQRYVLKQGTPEYKDLLTQADRCTNRLS